MSPVRLAVSIAAIATIAGTLSCNEHPLTPLGETLFVTTVEISGRLKSNDVDILWVVDNSPSMREEQVELGNRFDEFVSALGDLEANFNMAVVTTDPNDDGRFRTAPGNVQSNGCLEPPTDLAYCRNRDFDHPYLVASDYENEDGTFDETALASDFKCIASAGDCGESFEFGLEALRSSLDSVMLSGANDEFIRDQAFLLVVFLTDEDDCSNNGAFSLTRDADCYAAERRGDLVPSQEFYDFLVDLKGGQEEKILLAGIIGPDDGLPPQTFEELENDGPRFSCNLETENITVNARDGERYRELIDSVGSRGVEENICQGNFSAALTNIGEILREALDVNCLNEEPRVCENDDDCPDGISCLMLGDDADIEEDARYCANFEVTLEIQDAEGSEYRALVSPGTAGDSAPADDAEFDVNYDSETCQHGISFSFRAGARPPTGSRYRVSYPRSTELIDATNI